MLLHIVRNDRRRIDFFMSSLPGTTCELYREKAFYRQAIAETLYPKASLCQPVLQLAGEVMQRISLDEETIVDVKSP